MSGKVQNYKNHKRFDYPTYLILFPLGLLLLAGAVTAWVRYASSSLTLWETILATALSIAVFTVSMKARSYALVAQDRAIRAEEALRYFILTGKRLPSTLLIDQIVALRFASDEEFPTLVDQAALEAVQSEQIKKSIRQWRADLHRV